MKGINTRDLNEDRLIGIKYKCQPFGKMLDSIKREADVKPSSGVYVTVKDLVKNGYCWPIEGITKSSIHMNAVCLDGYGKKTPKGTISLKDLERAFKLLGNRNAGCVLSRDFWDVDDYYLPHETGGVFSYMLIENPDNKDQSDVLLITDFIEFTPIYDGEKDKFDISRFRQIDDDPPPNTTVSMTKDGQYYSSAERRMPLRAVSEQDRQIYYWAHMLDECRLDEDLGNRSYWSVWLNEYPQYKPDSPEIKMYLAQLFDRRMQKIDNLENKLKTYAKAYEDGANRTPYDRMKAALLASFGPEITDREFFWEPIPAQLYKALVSRNRAKSQGQVSRDVSPRVLKECLDSICRAAAMIMTHSNVFGNIIDISDTSTAKMLIDVGGSKDKWCLGGLYRGVSSFCTYEDGRKGIGEWLTNDSDSEIGADIEHYMKNQSYDVYESPDSVVPMISILVDKVHIRGSLAGAFVEGGAKTCAEVSNMAPDELYEDVLT